MLTVGDFMQPDTQTVQPDMSLSRLEELFLSSGFTGFPVTQEGVLVGVVSRSDVVRSLLTERSRAEQVSDYYTAMGPASGDSLTESLEKIAAQVGVRIAGLKVEDAMVHEVVSVRPAESIRDLAKRMTDGHLHRLPVVEEGRLVGLITSMDLVRAFADGRFVESNLAT